MMRRGSVVDDWEPILLSQLSHARYCLRRAALLINEQLWQENADTAKGRLEHQRVHTMRVERRGTETKLYEYPVFSQSLGLSGRCDCVEAVQDENGCILPTVDYPVRLYPVEFKHGKVREEEEYEIQLCAQAMCLEEMYQTEISEGAIFYISSHRRVPIPLTAALRDEVRKTIASIDRIRKEFIIPPAEYGSKCVRCSMRDLCMPQLQVSADSYCKRLAREAKEISDL